MLKYLNERKMANEGKTHLFSLEMEKVYQTDQSVNYGKVLKIP